MGLLSRSRAIHSSRGLDFRGLAKSQMFSISGMYRDWFLEFNPILSGCGVSDAGCD
jgi:hypothetical protein